MVEINNQRKAFLDMLAWSKGTDNGRQKTRNHGYDVICRPESYLQLLRSPSQTCHAKPKTQINRRPDATSFFPVGGMPTCKTWPLKDFSLRKSGRCGDTADGGVALYLWLVVVISVRPIDRCSNIGLHCRAGYGRFEQGWQPGAKFKEAGGTVRDWCMSRVTAIISALVICIIVCLS